MQDLYTELILDHNHNPKNFKKLEEANRTAVGYNPLCGDDVTIFLIGNMAKRLYKNQRPLAATATVSRVPAHRDS